MSSSVVTDPQGARPRVSRTTWLRGGGALALVEVILVLAGVIPAWLAIALAVISLGSYVGLRRRVTQPTARSVMWAVALSQAIVLIVPAVLMLAGWVIVAALAVAGAVILLLLLRDR